MKSKLPIWAILISVAVLGGLVALYNVFGYLYNFNQGALACAMHPFSGGGYGGILGVLVPGLFSLVSIALLVAVLWAIPARDTAADRPAMRSCPHCGRPLQADWRACPYCAWVPTGGEAT
jgi:hypothetical protein